MTILEEKPLVRLRGATAHQFIDFCADAYPEVMLVHVDGIVNIYDNTPAFDAWREFDEYMG